MPFRTLELDQEVFAGEGESAFGAVRQIANDHLVVYVENAGDISIDAAHVRSVHDGKVIVDVDALPEETREKIRRAHDSETDVPADT